MCDFFALYDCLCDNIRSDDLIKLTDAGDVWALAETELHSGMAMHVHGSSRPQIFPDGMDGISLRRAAEAVRSWNNTEASLAMAAINTFYNTEERLSALCCYEPFENYCTRGIDFSGKTVGIVGHMHGTDEMHRDAREIFTLEREPRGGDYPDPACDYLLPQCDIVLITGSAITNKTLPHLLDLCRDAYTILVGPSVPMCPELLDFGIDRLSGLVITDRGGIRERIAAGIGGSPYGHGKSFLLVK